MTLDVEWISGGSKNENPVFGAYKGRSGVEQFFGIVADTLNFSEFTPRDFFADGDKVIALGHYSAKMKKTGRRPAATGFTCSPCAAAR